MENSNSIVDLESSENPIMTSTRIEDSSNSMSLLKDNTLNEGFLIDSASLSLSAVNYTNINQSESEGDASGVTPSELERDQNTFSGIGESEDMAEGDDIEEPLVTAEGMAVEEEPDTENLFEESENITENESTNRPQSREEVEGDEEDEENDENEPEFPVPQFPISRIKKIMGVCLHTEEKEDEESTQVKEKGKGNIIITKEATYLMALATEYFVGTVGELAGRITHSSKKKTMTLEHLRRALSDAAAFEFLEGCFQPSVIIGD